MLGSWHSTEALEVLRPVRVSGVKRGRAEQWGERQRANGSSWVGSSNIRLTVTDARVRTTLSNSAKPF